ncbi:signal peptidase I, partial [Bacteroidota bacterium]
MKKIITNKYFKFSVAGLIFILWVIWLGNFWFLTGLAIIFDIYVSKKVNWAFWKKRDKKKNKTFVEWIDALIFAIVAVTIINIFLFQNFNIPTPSMEKSLLVGDYLFVSKVNYGPRLPNTPLSFPLVQHTLPLTKTTNSYLKWIQRPYKRIGGLSKIKNNDVVVFNYPVGDTVSTAYQSNISYYDLIKDYGREKVHSDERNFGKIVYRPVDKRENFIKRCVGIPGDVLEVKGNQLYINGTSADNPDNLQYSYYIRTNGSRINARTIERLGISKEDGDKILNGMPVPLITENLEKIKKLPNVVSIEIFKDSGPGSAFPNHKNFKWS